MNSKLIKASLAGVAAIAVAAGGSTFASWTDFSNVNGVQAGAGHLVLNVDQGALTAESMSLAPGQNQSKDFYIASNDGQSVPTGQLYITLKNLKDTEDGCTSNSEAAAEGVSAVDAANGNYDPATACGSNAAGNDNGELSQQARMEIWQYGPSSTGVCGLPASNSQVQNYAFVTTLENVKLPVKQLAPGEATCVRVLTQLLPTATNAVQGDKMSWDFRFDLEQV